MPAFLSMKLFTIRLRVYHKEATYSTYAKDNLTHFLFRIDRMMSYYDSKYHSY